MTSSIHGSAISEDGADFASGQAPSPAASSYTLGSNPAERER
jgi:hypothetical protein